VKKKKREYNARGGSGRGVVEALDERKTPLENLDYALGAVKKGKRHEEGALRQYQKERLKNEEHANGP